ncbi:MAG TPA: HEPN-associated N-terminal domain-containing protein [Actinomycetota bacterium]|nr:HEPN-associated N-terminal domain-containing protein [Actinomycetota bacterium]
MGYVKDLHERQFAQGWRFSELYICPNCIGDEVLRSQVADRGDVSNECSFCSGQLAAEFDFFMELFVEGVHEDFADANEEGIYYEGREGGYQAWPQWDTYELIDEYWDVLTGPGVLDAVKQLVEDRVWVRKNYGWPSRDEALTWGWERFCEAVQHETRYVFWLVPDSDETSAEYTGEVPASRILEEVGKLISRYDLLRELPPGSALWRARAHGPEAYFYSARQLGTAPREDANQSNRMSPAGISMFYGSDDAETAIAETAARTNQPCITVGRFKTDVACIVIDFTNLPSVPSVFDARARGDRPPLMFLHQFVNQLKKPARDRWEQLDYVPTQILTEYFLKVFLNGEAVTGLLYPSAQTGRASAVMDVDHQHCVSEDEIAKPSDSLRLFLEADSATTSWSCSSGSLRLG